MSLTGRILAGLLGLAGLPLAGLLVHQDLAAPWVAIVLLVLYEVVILLGTIVASVAQKVVRRRVEQVMDVLDLALGRRVSRYARYYRRYVLERDRHINARDLAYTPSHIPELDAVYVDVGLAPGSTTSHPGGLLPTSRADQAQRHSIHEFLDKDPAIVCAVIGAPGSGKSTLLRHTARLAASQESARSSSSNRPNTPLSTRWASAWLGRMAMHSRSGPIADLESPVSYSARPSRKRVFGASGTSLIALRSKAIPLA